MGRVAPVQSTILITKSPLLVNTSLSNFSKPQLPNIISLIQTTTSTSIFTADPPIIHNMITMTFSIYIPMTNFTNNTPIIEQSYLPIMLEIL
jgi:hypothetical protein